MLVLTRKQNESIIVGDNTVKITVLEIRGDKVRIGITVDNTVPVHREEVYTTIIKQYGQNRLGGKLNPETRLVDG